jgi:hypothetical protein
MGPKNLFEQIDATTFDAVALLLGFSVVGKDDPVAVGLRSSLRELAPFLDAHPFTVGAVVLAHVSHLFGVKEQKAGIVTSYAQGSYGRKYQVQFDGVNLNAGDVVYRLPFHAKAS